MQKHILALIILITFTLVGCSSEESSLYDRCVEIGMAEQKKNWDKDDQASVKVGVEQACKMMIDECNNFPDGKMCDALKRKFSNDTTKSELVVENNRKLNSNKISKFKKSDIYGEWLELGRAFAPTDDYSSLKFQNYGKRIFHPDGKFEFIKLEDGKPVETQVGTWDFNNNTLSINWPKSGLSKNKFLIFQNNVLGFQEVDSDIVVYLKK